MTNFTDFISQPENLDEANMSRVLDHTKNRNIGILTAHRGEHTTAENNSRNKDLEKDIRGHGFGFIHVRGRYAENIGTPEEKMHDEHSYLVIGKKGADSGHMKGFLAKHGEKYGQDSVVYKQHDQEHATLMGTKEGAYPGKGQTDNLGKFHPNKAPMYHSVMTRGGVGKANHKTFAFSPDDATALPSVKKTVFEGTDPYGGQWKDFGFYTPLGFFSRVETKF